MKNRIPPPRLAAWLFRLFIPIHERDYFFTAINEIFEDIYTKKGTGAARLWFWGQFFRSLPGFIKNSFEGSIGMLKNYLKLALRNIIKHKAYSFINISGLAIGMACTILILLWVQSEWSYDRFHENSPEISRVIINSQNPDGSIGSSYWNPGGIAPELKDKYPEIINYTRIRPPWPCQLKYKENISKSMTCMADPSFFTVFTFPLIKGDPQTVLSDPKSIVLTEEAAKRYFGDEDPIGKTITLDFWREFDLQVTGILKNVPTNSHLQFDCLIPFSVARTLGWKVDSWEGSDYISYLVLKKNSRHEEVNQKISGIIKERYPESNATVQLQPLTHIHLHKLGGGGPIIYIYIFSSMAIFILLIACINFMNLSTARSTIRAKEIGIRKVMGAHRKQLEKQFIGESILMAFIALTIAVAFVNLFLPIFNNLTGKEISIDYDGTIILSFFIIALITGIISGIYPAVFLSSFQPGRILKGVSRAGSKNPSFRKSLVVFQFVLSVFLIISATIVYNQLHYIKNINLGYDKEHVVCFGLSKGMSDKYDTVKQKLLQDSNVLAMTASHSSFINKNSSISGASWEGKTDEKKLNMFIHAVDYDYLKTFNMEMIQGRFFSEEFSTDAEEGIVLNEAAIEAMGIENPVGKQFKFPLFKTEKRGKIIGVVKDYNISSLHKEIKPLVLIIAPWWYYNFYVKIKPDDISNTMSYLEKTIQRIVPDFAFEYTFLDDDLDKLYRADQRMAEIIKYVMLLAIFISCLGLFGLASFTIEQRTKEIGVRKVLGASLTGIAALLLKEFIKLVLLGNIIVWPIAYFIMNRWLQNFAYHISINFWVFLLTGMLTFLIAAITVSYQAIKAAIANPVEALKYDIV